VASGLSAHDKQYAKDQEWLLQNKREIEQAARLLMDYLMERKSPSRSELTKARAMVDQSNAIHKKYPMGAPPPASTRKAVKRKVYLVRRSKPIKADADGNVDLVAIERQVGKWKAQVEKVLREIDRIAQPMQRGKARRLAESLYAAIDGLRDAYNALNNEALYEIDRMKR
jgi:hypothetical protein